MITSGWFSTLLTTMLAWSPPGDSLGGKPMEFNLQDFRGGWHRLDDAGKEKAVVRTPDEGRESVTDRIPRRDPDLRKKR